MADRGLLAVEGIWQQGGVATRLAANCSSAVPMDLAHTSARLYYEVRITYVRLSSAGPPWLIPAAADPCICSQVGGGQGDRRLLLFTSKRLGGRWPLWAQPTAKPCASAPSLLLITPAACLPAAWHAPNATCYSVLRTVVSLHCRPTAREPPGTLYRRLPCVSRNACTWARPKGQVIETTGRCLASFHHRGLKGLRTALERPSSPAEVLVPD